jgi:hypothetical protein
VTLRGHRDEAQVATWATRFFDVAACRRRVEGGIVTFTAKNAVLLHATEGDVFGLSWGAGPTRENGHPYKNEVLRIIGVSHVLDSQPQSAVTALSLNRYLTAGGVYDATVFYDEAKFYGGRRDLTEAAA